jgi:hypothetical protein
MRIIKTTATGLKVQKKLGVLLVIVVFASATLATEMQAQSGIITVRGGNITMNITTGAAGSQPVAVTNTTTTLRYWRQAKIAKITVTTSCPTQAFNLQVVATGVTYGVAAPAVSLTSGMLAVDFITNIPSAGVWVNTTPTLQYTASATFAQGNSAELGNDLHTLTYTLVVQ